MEISKLAFGSAIAIAAALLSKLAQISPDPPEHISNEFVTATATYRIPTEVIIPGSLLNTPQEGDLQTDGPSVDLFLKNATFGASDSLDGSDIHVTLVDIDQTTKAALQNSQRKTAALTRATEAVSQNFVVDRQLGLYRVYSDFEPEYGEWDLVRYDFYETLATDSEPKVTWVGSCFLENADNSPRCVYETEILGIYAYISTSESNYKVLESIRSELASLLDKWEI